MNTPKPRHPANQTVTFHPVAGEVVATTSQGVLGDIELLCQVARKSGDPSIIAAAGRIEQGIKPLLESAQVPMPGDAHFVKGFQELRTSFARVKADNQGLLSTNRGLLEMIVTMGDALTKAKLPTPAMYLEAVAQVGRPLTDAEQAAQDAGWAEVMEGQPPAGSVQ